MRLSHPHQRTADRQPGHERVGDRGGERLDQVERAGVGDILDGVDDQAIVDRLIEVVAAGSSTSSSTS